MEIYSSVPEEKITEPEEADKYDILNFLVQNKGKFYTAKQIAEEVGFPTKGTQVEVRKAITELIEIDNYPIVSNSFGFGYAVHPNQIKVYIEKLEARKQGLVRRINSLQKILSDWLEIRNNN